MGATAAESERPQGRLHCRLLALGAGRASFCGLRKSDAAGGEGTMRNTKNRFTEQEFSPP